MQPHPPQRMMVAAEDVRDGSRATYESLGDLALHKIVWLRTYAQNALLRKRRVSGGHVRVHTTIPQRCDDAQFAFAQHTWLRAYIVAFY